ncbi:hypothetical protein [Sulfoacidibacillus thermotolerans]|uniref:Uncharacterized protein n=1 Tax=Sulfoacidibacillus thermotolerans TaxID=1765684 RepID=A0A2U3DAD0_SULT2|nr:hypothetical protein [Sulfoacidibacillus thermotolerans]PWI58237.1 hypothetical protein BM613_04735 [Sulfoacidibacillus thermotolerans]
MRNVRRAVWAVMISMIAMSVTGCGFVNVQTLTPNAKRTSVVVVGTSAVLSSFAVASALEGAIGGITAVSITAPEHVAQLEQDLQVAHARAVIFLNPTSAEQALAQTQKNVHFVWIGYSGSQIPPANVTWIIPNVQRLASIAGYLAGGIHGYGKPVGILLGSLPSDIRSSDVVAAISSGMHCAYSSAIPELFAGSTQQQLAMLASNPVRDLIVIGGLTSAVKSAVQALSLPVIDVNLGARGLSYQTQIGQLDVNAFDAAALSLALHTLEANSALPSVLQTSTGEFVALSGYPGWQGSSGVQVYQTLCTTGKITPSQYANTSLPVQTALAWHLPVPPVLMPSSALQGPTTVKTGAQGTSVTLPQSNSSGSTTATSSFASAGTQVSHLTNSVGSVPKDPSSSAKSTGKPKG